MVSAVKGGDAGSIKLGKVFQRVPARCAVSVAVATVPAGQLPATPHHLQLVISDVLGSHQLKPPNACTYSCWRWLLGPNKTMAVIWPAHCLFKDAI
jgi:hypothetical protein